MASGLKAATARVPSTDREREGGHGDHDGRAGWGRPARHYASQCGPVPAAAGRRSLTYAARQRRHRRIGQHGREVGIARQPPAGERAQLAQRPLQVRQHRLDVVAQRVQRGQVVARERVVGPGGQTAIERLDGAVAEGAGFLLGAEPEVGRRQLLVHLDDRPIAQRVIGERQEIELAAVLPDRVLVLPAQVVHVAEPGVRADDDQPLRARHRPLLQVHRFPGVLFGGVEVAVSA